MPSEGRTPPALSPPRLRIHRAKARVSLATVHKINVELTRRRLELIRDRMEMRA